MNIGKRLLQFLFLLFTIAYASDTKEPIVLHAPKIVLITIDGTRWQDIFDQTQRIGELQPTSRELMPTLYSRFVDHGMAIGKSSPAFVGGPNHVSQPGYLEIISGRPHLDCTDNNCPPNTKPTIIDQFSNEATVIAGWNTISKVFDNSIATVNIGHSIRNKWSSFDIPEDSEEHYFDDDEYRSDNNTTKIALEYLKVEQPNFLWVSLGDTDEWAHQNNMMGYWFAMSDADDFLRNLMKLTDPNTVYIVCPDHGRGANFYSHGLEPESAKVWIMIAGPNIPEAGFVSYNRDVYLSDIVPTIMYLTKGIQSHRSLLNYQK